MNTTFSVVAQFEQIIELIDKHFPSLTENQKAEILKLCFKFSAS